MKQSNHTLKRILQYLKPYAGYLVGTLILATVTVALTLAIPYLVGLAIDCIVGKNAVDFAKLYELFLAIGIAIGVTALAQWLMSLSNQKIAYDVLSDLRRDAFSKIQTLPLKYIDRRSYGEIASTVITDAEQFSDGLLLGFTQLFTGLMTIIGTLVIMLVLRWQVALVVFCVTPVSLFVAKFIASRTHSMFQKQAEARAKQTAFIDEMVGNLKVVKAFSHEDANEAQFQILNEELKKTALKATFFSSTTNPSTRFVNSVVYALVALVGAFTVLSTGGAFTVGYLSTFLSYSNQYTKPFNEISEVIAEFQNALACASRVFALLETPSERAEERKTLPAVKGKIDLNDVSFSYQPERKLIENLTVHVKAGQRVAIVGPTGCGKTTLINLLMRFYDVQSGSICIDGQNIYEVTRSSLRENYGMVLQETWLKADTVRANLCMGKPDCTEEEMIEASKSAHAHSFIKRLPNGYDTVIGEECALSQGQKQLLCIARIMLCAPPMLILDEATSSIDTRTEKKIQDAFSKLMQGRTSFIVAHRLSTIENADLILVMKEGTIIEQGTHQALLDKKGFYAELYNAQFAGV